jgi:hypothetical protein
MIFNTSSSTFQVFNFVTALNATFLESHGTPAVLAGAFKEKAKYSFLVPAKDCNK